jgi:hypothetical protein
MGSYQNVLFYQSKIHYLGHIISGEGITMDPVKVEAIMEYPTLTNVQEVRRFMGFAGYYQWFVKGFSKMDNIIIEL